MFSFSLYCVTVRPSPFLAPEIFIWTCVPFMRLNPFYARSGSTVHYSLRHARWIRVAPCANVLWSRFRTTVEPLSWRVPTFSHHHARDLPQVTWSRDRNGHRPRRPNYWRSMETRAPLYPFNDYLFRTGRHVAGLGRSIIIHQYSV